MSRGFKLGRWMRNGWAPPSISLFFIALAVAAIYLGYGYEPDSLVVQLVPEVDGHKAQKWYRVPKPTVVPTTLLTPTPGALATPGSAAAATPVPTPGQSAALDALFDSQGMEGKYDLAVKAVNGSDWTKAQYFLEKYVALDPNRALAYYLLGYVQWRQKKDDPAAIPNFERFLKSESSRASKYRFSAASELVYLYARTLPRGLEKAALERRDILFDQREAAYAIDRETGDRVREAWEYAIWGRGGKYALWSQKLKALPLEDYVGPKAAELDPDR